MKKRINIGLTFLFVSTLVFILSSDTWARELGSADTSPKVAFSKELDTNIKEFNRLFGLKDWLTSQPAFFVAPTISSISPSSPRTSVTDQNIRVNGSNFVSGLTVTVTFPGGGTGTLSGSQLVNVTSTSFTMKITLNGTGTWQIRVNNPNGEVSGQFPFSVSAAVAPTISSISPSSPTVSSSNQNVVVNGSNFQDGLTVTVFFPGGGSSTLSGTQITNVSTTSFTMVVTLNVLGTYGIRVNNPSNLQSSTFNFATQQPTPSISGISPSGVCAQNGDRTFTVTGSNFVSGLTVTVFFPAGGSTTLSGAQIQFSSSTSFNMIVTLNVVGTYNFRVNNPSGAQSANRSYTTQDCNPSVSSVSPSTPTVSNSDQTVVVSGTNFQSGLTVTIFFPGGGSGTLQGTQIQFNSSTSFNMIVTLNVVGQYQIRVNNPNGTVSTNFAFNTQAAPPTISSVSPTTPCVRNVDQSIVVNGTNFVSGLTVTVFFPGGGSGTLSGTQIQSVTSTSFTMIITLGEPGTYNLRVNNPSGAQSATFNMLTQNCLSVSGINPASPIQSNVDQNIVVNGNGFVANLSVIVTLPDLTTVTLSGTQILNVTANSFTMKITLNGTGTWKIKVRNPNGDLSNLFQFTVQAAAAPIVSSLNPPSPSASNVDQNVTVTGSNFQPGLTVTLTFPGGGTGTLSGTQIQNVTGTSFTMRVTFGGAGTWSMRVNNSNGGQSAPFGFTVLSNVQAPVIYSINPITPIARGTDQDVVVSGSNFQQNLQVPITFPGGGGTTLSGAQIQNVTSTSFIMRATLNGAGGWTIKVQNPDGGLSAPYAFTVTNGTNPVINTINPTTPTSGGADQSVTVNGANFQSGLKVNVTFPNGGVGSLQGTGQIQNVTANSFLMRITLNDTGPWTIRVINPDNSQSGQFQFTVNASGPPPTGLPTSVLSPVVGPLRVTSTNQGTRDGLWEFNQHKTGYHTATGGISLSNDTYAWDANLYTPTSGNADAGKTVYATAVGQVVTFVGTQPGAGPGAVLVAHPNAAAPLWFSGYLHLNGVRVTPNQFVDSNTIIGDVGRTGAENDHLHFVVYSGTNTRGNLRSFNVPVIERLANGTNPPTISSLVPSQVEQASQPRLITINGSNFQSNSIIVVERPDGVSETITPQAIAGTEGSRILSTTASSITALVNVGLSGTHSLSVVNGPIAAKSDASLASGYALSQPNELGVSGHPRRTPVIIIPGIMGSRLAKRDGNGYDELFPHLPEYRYPWAYDKHIQLKDNIGDGRPIPQRTIVATDIFRDYLEGFGGIYYNRLIERLKTSLDYKEYFAVDRPEFRTAAGCSLSQTDRDLFLFAYDWRNKNEQSAADLRDFVVCIRQLYGNDPNFKVQIIAHSMGGLIARRYILEGLYGTNQNYDPYVDRMITLGTPWLGSPKAILPLYNGNFDQEVNKLVSPDVLNQIARAAPGPHELLPSRVYVDELGDQSLPANSGDYPFGEDGYDIFHPGPDRIYTFQLFEGLMNIFRPLPGSPIRPGTDTDLFHNKIYAGRRLQDDWRVDPSSNFVTYYNFTGLINNSTIGSLVARRVPTTNAQGQTVSTPTLQPEYARGDGTVTSISADRTSGRDSYLGNHVRARSFSGVNHNGLPNDLGVFNAVKCVLENPNPDNCLPAAKNHDLENAMVDEPVYSMSVTGSTSVLITDSFGNTSDPLSTSFFEGIPTIPSTVTDAAFVNAIVPLDQNYRFVIRTSSTPLMIAIVKTTGSITNQAVRYVDVTLPPNVLALIQLSPQGISTLLYDSNGDGTFDTSVDPTINVTGTQAQDIDAPQLNINETVQGGNSRIDLDATDSGTGVQRVMYSINGTTFQQYSAPLTLNATTTPTIYAYADDNVFNRSGLISLNLTASNAGYSVSGPGSAPAGGSAVANWNAPAGRPVDDWIGLFRVGTLNSAFVSKQYTGGSTTGNLSFTLPNQAGTYEFRYLLSDGYSSVAASSPITVGSVTRSPFDFDGDAKTDISVFRPNGGTAEWWWLKSSNGGNAAVQFGSATDTIVPADFTGDGKADVAYWRPSTGFWYVLRSDDLTFYAFPFGGSGDVPAPADYDADGKADAAVFRPSTATWYISNSGGGTTIQQFGLTTDKPVAADYDGDGKADIAVYRPTGANGAEWWIMKSSGGTFATQFGSATDKAVPADYTGDGKADIAFWLPASGQWFILRSEDLTYYAFPFGGSGDSPVPGDYDGDGKADAAVFRPSSSTWYANKSGGGTLIQQFGIAGDLPVPNAFVR